MFSLEDLLADRWQRSTAENQQFYMVIPDGNVNRMEAQGIKLEQKYMAKYKRCKKKKAVF